MRWRWFGSGFVRGHVRLHKQMKRTRTPTLNFKDLFCGLSNIFVASKNLSQGDDGGGFSGRHVPNPLTWAESRSLSSIPGKRHLPSYHPIIILYSLLTRLPLRPNPSLPLGYTAVKIWARGTLATLPCSPTRRKSSSPSSPECVSNPHCPVPVSTAAVKASME